MRNLADYIDTILNGSEDEKSELVMSYFKMADTPDFLKKLGLAGNDFTIRYGVITHHKNKDSQHNFTVDEWKTICKKISEPFAIAKYKGGFNLYLDMKKDGNCVLVGVKVKTVGKDIFVNAVQTIFAKDIRTKVPDIVYMSKKITASQRTLLDGTNSRQYPVCSG